MRNIFFFLGLLLGTYMCTFAQISEGGLPKSIEYKISDKKLSPVVIPGLSEQKINEIKEQNSKDGTFYKIGQTIPVNLGMTNSGTWTNLQDGGKIWRLSLKSSGAQGLVVYYDNFYLPAGTKMFVYDEDMTQIMGAYTEFNNHESGLFSNEMILGDNVIIEFYQPAYIKSEASISISGLGYIFRDAHSRSLKQVKEFGDSDDCQVNVNCSPEGDNWQNEKKGVVRILLTAGGGQGWCTGSVLNNIRQDCAPYILTADHCGHDATTQELTQWIFYFNYEAPSCSNPTSEGTLASQTMTGCTKIANGGNSGNDGSDFYLVRLTTDIPVTNNVYFNGWSKQDVAPTSGVGIHHPSGDIKKISTYASTLSTTGWNGSAYDSHWQVYWTSSTNGFGVTEQGSSGSPIFDQNKRVVGDLTGGGSYCTATDQPDYYGKFSYSWESNGTTDQEKLKPWLDPDNTGANYCNGSFCGATLYANFTQNATDILVTNSVTFTDQSAGNPTAWKWSFEGGTPATSSLQNPTVAYNAIGLYNVELIITKGTQKDTLLKQDLINVHGPETHAYFDSNRDTIAVGQTVNFIDTSYCDTTIVSWLWTFEGGTPATSTAQNPVGIRYDSLGYFDVTLKVCNQWGCDSLLKTNYITVIDTGGMPPIASFAADFTTVIVGNSINFFDLSAYEPTDWEWTFTGGTPSTSSEKNPSNITYDVAGTYPVKLVVLNAYGTDTIEKTGYIYVTTGITTQLPIADFWTPLHLLQVGDHINYTDKSTGGVATSWSWTLEGGFPNSSTNQHPLFIEYTSPGAHAVSLTVSNMAGSNTKTIDEYIFVSSTPVFNYCDSTITNVNTNESLVCPTVTGSTGYISGHNGKTVTAYADLFDYYIYTQIKGLVVPVAKAYAGTTDSKVTFNVWSVGSNGLPGSLLGSKDVKISTFTPGYFHSIQFDNPVTVNGNFFVGYEISYSSADTFAVYIASNRGTNGNNTLYAKYNSAWTSATSLYSYKTSTAIKPISCIVGIEDVEQSIKEVFVYPNPTNDWVNIQFADIKPVKKQLNIVDMTGKIINVNIERINDNHYMVNFNGVDSGLYFLIIDNGYSRTVKKISVLK